LHAGLTINRSSSSVANVFLLPVGAPQAADGGASLHLDAERLALLQKQAPCLIILDFK
jgi:hypothetical protein